MPSVTSRLASLGAVTALVVAAFLLSWGLVAALDLPTDPEDYNLVRWEVRYFPSKWLFEVGSLFRDRPDTVEETNRVVERFLALSAGFSRLEDADDLSTSSPELGSSRQEAQRLENTVESILEERVSAVAGDLGLESSWPLLGLSWLFPPIDFEFAAPPRVLAVSPRDRIHLESSTLLRSDLTLEETVALEARREANGVSALVVGIGEIGRAHV